MNTSKSGILDQFKLTPLIRFFRLLAVDQREILYIYIYALFNGLINLSIPLGIQAIINLISGGEVTYSWIILSGIVILGTLFAGIMQIMMVSINERVQQKIFTRSAFEFSYRMPRLKIEALKNHYAPELVNRFFDTLTIQKGLDKVLIDFSTASLQIIFGLLLLCFYSPYFIFLSVIFILLAVLIFWLTGPAGMRSANRESNHKYEVAYWLEELGRAMSTFKLAGIPGFTMQKTDNLVSNWLDARKNHFRLLLIQFSSMVILKVLITAGILLLGGALVINQQLNIGQFVASEIIIIILLSSVEKLIRTLETIYDVVIATEKISVVTDQELEEEGGTRVLTVNDDEGISVTADHLTYYSPLGDMTILNDINLHIEKGEKVCISGFNGSGKSMLLNNLAGLYENYSGTILFNDIPRANLDLNDLRSNIGDNLSEEDVFHGTINENITIGREDVSDALFKEAIEATDLTSFVKKMPQGYDTVVGPKSFMLSKSFIKSIILARSIVRNPSLMTVEDDFTQFESSKKKKLIEYLTGKEQKWTLLFVSNDKAVLNACEKVVVLDQGQLIAHTTPEEIKKMPWFDQIFS